MLYHTVQHLCFTGALRVHFEEVPLKGGRGRAVRRLFLARDTSVRPTSASEAFTLELFPTTGAISLGELRQWVDRKIKDHERYKYELVFTDLREAGLMASHHWRTAAGRKAFRHTRDTLFTVHQDIGRSLPGGWERSLKHVQELWSSIVLLNDRTRERLIEASSRRSDLIAAFSILAYLETTSAADARDGYISGMGGFGGFVGGAAGGGGGFGGFGGGGFGGGGAGGSW